MIIAYFIAYVMMGLVCLRYFGGRIVGDLACPPLVLVFF